MSNQKRKETTGSGFIPSLKEYFRGVKSEWGKVTWPERRQVISETFVVLGVVIFFTITVHGLDSLYSLLIGLLGFNSGK